MNKWINLLLIISSTIIFIFKRQLIFLFLPALFLFIMLLVYLAAKNPEANWAKILFKNRKVVNKK